MPRCRAAARRALCVSFPDVVDSRFTGQVDNLPDIVDSVPSQDYQIARFIKYMCIFE